MGKGAPSQKTCRSPRIPNPSRKEDSCFVVLSFFSRSSWPPSPSPACAAAAIVHIRVEGKTQTIFGAHRAARRPARMRSTCSTSTARAAEFFAHVTQVVVRPVRRPDRLLPGGRPRRLGLQGERHLAAGRCRPGAAEGRRPRCSGTSRSSGRPAARRRSRCRARRSGCYRATGQDDAGDEKVPPGSCSTSARSVVPRTAGHVCPKSPHGLVWATRARRGSLEPPAVIRLARLAAAQPHSSRAAAAAGTARRRSG